MERAQAPRGSIYYYFPEGKYQLIAEVIGRTEEQLVALAAVASLRNDTVDSFLNALIDHQVRRLVDSDFAEGCPLAALAASAQAAGNELCELVDTAFSTWISTIARALIDKGMATAEAGRVANNFVAAVEGAIVLSRASRIVEPLEAVRAMVPPWSGSNPNDGAGPEALGCSFD